MTGEHIDGLDETRMRRVLPSLFAALDAMRAIDLSAASGFGAGLAASGFAAEQTGAKARHGRSCRRGRGPGFLAEP